MADLIIMQEKNARSSDPAPSVAIRRLASSAGAAPAIERDGATIVVPAELIAAGLDLPTETFIANLRAGVVYAVTEKGSVSENKISVLTPVGTALLGLPEGECMPYEAADGTMRHLTVHRVLFQPEANGMGWL